MDKKYLTEGERIDTAYHDNWRKINRDTFDAIIALDPQTSQEYDRIGLVATQLLLPKYREGEKQFLDYADDVIEAIKEYYATINDYPKELKNVANFPTVKDFTEYVLLGDHSTFGRHLLGIEGPEQESEIDYHSRLVDVLRNGSDWIRGINNYNWNDVHYIGSSDYYDVFKPTTNAANAAIAGSRRDNSSYGANCFGRWCTSARNHSSYFGNYANQRSSFYFDFIYRPDYDYLLENPEGREAQTKRQKNFQFVISTNGNIGDTGDGNDNMSSGEQSERRMKNLILSDPSLLKVMEKDPILSQTRPFKELQGSQSSSLTKYRFVYNGSESIERLKNDKLFGFEAKKGMIKKILIAQGVRKIPSTEFAGWANLEEVKFLSEDIESIGAQAFKNCPQLTKFRLPKHIQTIGPEAFANCQRLKNLYLPATLNTIGERAFYNTNIKLTLSEKRPDNSLHVSPEDIPWLSTHLKASNIPNESLQEKLNVDEELLDENIPFDLAKAYGNSLSNREDSYGGLKSDASTWGTTPSAGWHKELSPAKKARRNINVDYANSNYEQITADEAWRRISANIGDINKLRALFRNDAGVLGLAEWSHRPDKGPRTIYNIYIAQLSTEAVNKLEQELGYGVVAENSTKYCNSSSKLEKMLQVADKLYWTDEYAHIIDDNTELPGRMVKKMKPILDPDTLEPLTDPETGKVLMEPVLEPEKIRDRRRKNSEVKNLVNYNYVGHQGHLGQEQHNNAGNFSHSYDDISWKRYAQVDTGAHTPANRYMPKNEISYNSVLSAYNKATDTRDSVFKQYDSARKALKQLNSNREYYTDEEFAVKEDKLKSIVNTQYDRYMVAANALKIIKDKVVLELSDDIIDRRANIIEKVKLIQEKATELFNAKNELNKVASIIVDPTSNEHNQEINKQIADINGNINNLNKQLNSYQEELRATLERIARLQETVEQLQTSISNGEVLRDSAIQSVVELKDQLIDNSDDLVAQVISAEKALENKVKEAQRWFEENNFKKFGKQETKEMSASLKRILGIAAESTKAVEKTA